jgi:hypothetical protein
MHDGKDVTIKKMSDRLIDAAVAAAAGQRPRDRLRAGRGRRQLLAGLLHHQIFHVAHAGVYTWAAIWRGRWSPTACRSSWRFASRWRLRRRRGADPGQLYARLERRHATHLVILIASLGTLAVMQNIIAAVYSPEHPAIPLPWASEVVAGAACG